MNIDLTRAWGSVGPGQRFRFLICYTFHWARPSHIFVGRKRQVIPKGSAAASNHEEPVGRVAPELLDEAIFPIEIGLHRAGSDIGSLIGTPVAV